MRFDFFSFLGVVIFSFSLLASAQYQYVCMYCNMYMTSNHSGFGLIHEFLLAMAEKGERIQIGVFLSKLILCCKTLFYLQFQMAWAKNILCKLDATLRKIGNVSHSLAWLYDTTNSKIYHKLSPHDPFHLMIEENLFYIVSSFLNFDTRESISSKAVIPSNINLNRQ